ncbi:MAG: hypothetical protein ACM31O_01655 [Bacteroidota bacterium]
MSFLAFRQAVIADIRANLVSINPADAALKPFREVTPSPRNIDETWLEYVSKREPGIHVCFIGSSGAINRNHMGQLIGPWATVAHIVTAGSKTRPAEDVMLDLLHTFMVWVEGRTFGFAATGPAEVLQTENLWDVRVDERGLCLGSVMWRQEISFGPELGGADMQADLLRLFDKDGAPIAFPESAPDLDQVFSDPAYVAGKPLLPDADA